jgi:hypothetical protein
LLSTDGGQNWRVIQQGISEQVFINSRDHPNTVLAIDPGNPNRVFYCQSDSDQGGFGIWEYTLANPATSQATALINHLEEGKVTVQDAVAILRMAVGLTAYASVR